MDDFSAGNVPHMGLSAGLNIEQLLQTLANSECELKQQVRLFSAIIDALPNPTFVKDNDAVFIACNKAYEEAFGISREDFIGKTVLDLSYLPEATRLEFQRADQALLQQRGETREEIELAFASGPPKTVLYQRRTFELGEGLGGGMLGIIIDISQRKQAEDFECFRSRILEMLAGGSSLELTLQAIVQGVESLHPNMLCSILLADSEGRSLVDGVAPSLPDFYTEAVNGVPINFGVGSCGTAAFTGERVIVENIATHPYWAEFKDLAARAGLASCWSQPVHSSTASLLGTFAIYHRTPETPSDSEIELIEHIARLASIAIEKTHAESTIRQLAFYDPLTQLPNRRMLSDRLVEAMADSQASGSYAALMLLDLDKFKPLNDVYGHSVGDLLLVEVAERLVGSVRCMDLVARLGGDEFIVVLDNLDPDLSRAQSKAKAVAESIRDTLARPYALTLQQEGHMPKSITYQCSPSIGVAFFLGCTLSQEKILHRADQAMYKAKQSGGHAICQFDSCD
ncbi:MAG: diguanylate cyclase [Oceanospirillales bacterium]|nr:diguanylate cyclase [Oceanospirillales bacterium]